VTTFPGIVNHVSPSAYDRALEIAREIVPNGPIALRAAKKAVELGLQGDITSGMVVEELCYAQVIPTKDRLEGLAAFKEKRKPVYKGE
jgi:methylglutaconyl-CoA hydratase